MEHKHHTQDLVREIPEFSSRYTTGGVAVNVRCLEISRSRKLRYEIYIDAEGSTAVVDVPAEEYDRLPSRIDDFVGAFVDSLRLRAAYSWPSREQTSSRW